MASTPKGNCYEVHFRFFRDNLDRDEQRVWRLCHGTVTNGEGKSFGHCWLEHDGFALDLSNGNSFKIKASEYRERLHARDVTEYTSQEMAINMVRQRHYGPWK